MNNQPVQSRFSGSKASLVDGRALKVRCPAAWGAPRKDCYDEGYFVHGRSGLDGHRISRKCLRMGFLRPYRPRQERQEFRIRQGVASGELTRREYWRLEREQAYIRGLERNAEADGYVSPYERARIRAAQDAASRRIHEERHDGQRRWSRRAW